MVVVGRTVMASPNYPGTLLSNPVTAGINRSEMFRPRGSSSVTELKSTGEEVANIQQLVRKA